MRIKFLIYIIPISVLFFGAAFAGEEISMPVSIPKEFAKIESVHTAARISNPWVIQIEDAHCVVQAQKNIHGLLEHLQKKYGVRHVYLEGGEGALAISRLNENFLEKKLNLGEISGAEFTAATNKNSTEYYGIENQKLYDLNREALLEAAKGRAVRDRILAKLRQKLAGKAADVDLLLKASRLDLERTEYEKFKQIYDRLDSFFDNSEITAQSADWTDLQSLFKPVMKFYQLVLERDRVMGANVLKRLRKDKASVAVLITGGFHSKAISEMLNREGISSVVVTPEFSSWSGRENYLRALKKVRSFA